MTLTFDIRSPEFRADPYRVFRRLRAESPVCRIATHGHWAIAKHGDVQAVLRNPRLFSSTGIGPPPTSGPRLLLESRGLIGTDPPEHTRLRNLVNRAFAPNVVRGLGERVRSVARDLLRPLRRQREFDLVAGFSMPLPTILLSGLLGIDAERREDFKRWTQMLLTWRNTKFIVEPVQRLAREAQIADDTAAMFTYLSEVIAQRTREPRDDLISMLVLARDANEWLTPDEVLSFVRILLVAGTEASTNLIGNGILALCAHPDQWQQVRGDPAMLPRLVEETLRYDGPVIALMRKATADTEVAGVKITKGDLVLPLVASANHDAAVFPTPERFDLGREDHGHLGFGGSVHFCMGAPFARLQAQIAFEEFFAAFPTLQRADAQPLAYLDSFFFRGVRRLMLRP